MKVSPIKVLVPWFLFSAMAMTVMGSHEVHDGLRGSKEAIVEQIVAQDEGMASAENQERELVSSSDFPNLAKKFAPLLAFDNSMQGWPMNAEYFYERILLNEQNVPGRTNSKDGYLYHENDSKSPMLNGDVPLYYKAELCSGDIVMITYYMAFGFQHQCNLCYASEEAGMEGGYHQGGFEQATVVLNKAATGVKGVIFKQHTGWYFRTNIRKDSQGRPYVYVGAIQHGTYDDKKCSGGSGGDDVTYWADERCDDVVWDPKDSLYQIASTSYQSPAKFKNTFSQEWLKEVASISESEMNTAYDTKYAASLPDNHEKWGSQFIKKAVGLRVDSWCDKRVCKGQTKLKAQGCDRAVCLNASGYTDWTKDSPFRCVEGCGDGWKAISKSTCQKRHSLKTKNRDNWPRDRTDVVKYVLED